MTTIVRTVTVPAPISKVAAYLSDFTNTAQWDPSTESCRRLDSGPLAIGSRYENVQKSSRNTPFSYTVEEYEPGRRIMLTGHNPRVRSRDEMVFTPTAQGGTSVTYTVDVVLRGWAKAGQFVMPLVMKRIADKAEQGMRERLLDL